MNSFLLWRKECSDCIICQKLSRAICLNVYLFLLHQKTMLLPRNVLQALVLTCTSPLLASQLHIYSMLLEQSNWVVSFQERMESLDGIHG